MEVLAQRSLGDAPFDFAGLSPAQSSATRHFLVQESCFLIANPDDLSVKFQTELPENLSPSLLKFVFGLDSPTDGRPLNAPFLQEIDHRLSHAEGLWVPISNTASKKSQPLTEGEFVRFGRQIFRVAKILTGDHLTEERKKIEWLAKLLEKIRSLGKGPTATMRKVITVQSSPNLQTQNPICHFCEDENDPGRPLLEDICDCKSTVHLDCLAAVMAPRAQPETRKGLTYFDLSGFCCPLCEAPLEPFVRVKKHHFSLLDLYLQESTHVLVLEKISYGGPFVDGVLVVDFTRRPRPVLMGTDPDCDIILPSRHASAVHAQLVLHRNAFYIVNLSEQFGSLRKLDVRVDLPWLHGQFLVSGPFMLSFHVNQDKKQCRCAEKGLDLENPLAHETSILDSLLISQEIHEEAAKPAERQVTAPTAISLSPEKLLRGKEWGATPNQIRTAETQEDGGRSSPARA